MAAPSFAVTFPLALATLFAVEAATAQGPSIHATRVVAFDTRGQAGGGVFDPSHTLGRPNGSQVHSLGRRGYLTLGFDVNIVDGPGADLIVVENPFASISEPWKTFAEVAFVEVSSDGVHFARFPSRYTGSQVEPGPFDFLDTGNYANLTGRFAFRANATDLQDVVDAGADAFDLADLRGDPLVQSGRVDLNAITEVRIVDVESGVDVDSRGVTIRDTGSPGSADIDGVILLNHAGNQRPDGPSIELTIPADGRYRLVVSDPDGLTDLDPASLRLALWNNELPFAELFAVSTVTQVSNTSFTLELAGSLPASVKLAMQVSVKDFAGGRSGASATRP